MEGGNERRAEVDHTESVEEERDREIERERE